MFPPLLYTVADCPRDGPKDSGPQKGPLQASEMDEGPNTEDQKPKECDDGADAFKHAHSFFLTPSISGRAQRRSLDAFVWGKCLS